MSNLFDRRSKKADEVYAFGEMFIEVEAADGWEWDTGSNEARRTIYLAAPDGDASEKAFFVVRFHKGTALLEDAYGIDMRGEHVGNVEGTSLDDMPSSKILDELMETAVDNERRIKHDFLHFQHGSLRGDILRWLEGREEGFVAAEALIHHPAHAPSPATTAEESCVDQRPIKALYEDFIHGDPLSDSEVLRLREQFEVAAAATLPLGERFKLAFQEAVWQGDRLRDICSARGI